MRPPICAVCDRDFRDDLEESDLAGDLVTFIDYEALPEGMVGHPKGVEWFCSKHIRKAKILSHLSSKVAIYQIRQFDQ